MLSEYLNCVLKKLLPAFLLLTGLWGCLSPEVQAQKLQRFEFQDPHMGTLFRLVLYARDAAVARTAADSVFRRIEVLDDMMSDYQENSELNRLTLRSGNGEFVRVSPPLFYVVDKSLELSELTAGAFDITVGPYVQLWRKMWQEEKPRLPDKHTLNEAGYYVGHQLINIDRQNLSVALERPRMKLDLGGIAKGYAADEALEVLYSFGIRQALVDAGGDIVLGDAPPGKEGWRVSVASQNQNTIKGMTTLILRNKAIATSGDLFRFIEIDGKRYSHIIDPRTGLGLTNRSMVTVVAPDGITADSYASAVSVMGPEKGVEFIESRPGTAVRIEYEEQGHIKVRTSLSFRKLRTAREVSRNHTP